MQQNAVQRNLYQFFQTNITCKFVKFYFNYNFQYLFLKTKANIVKKEEEAGKSLLVILNSQLEQMVL